MISKDVDYNGGDLPNQPVSKTVSSAAECAALCCAAQPACDAFSVNAGSAGSRWCYLKGASGYSIGPSPGCDSGCLRGDCDVPPPPPPGTYFPWFDLSIPRATRVALLVANMTQAEAIHWLNDGVPAIPRLGLPAYSWEAEALHGVSWNGVATVFPQNIAWGATFDVPLIARVADTIALEARAKWVAGLGADGSSAEFAGLSFMTPNNNLFIDPLWGRGQEVSVRPEGGGRGWRGKGCLAPHLVCHHSHAAAPCPSAGCARTRGKTLCLQPFSPPPLCRRTAKTLSLRPPSRLRSSGGFSSGTTPITRG